MKKANKKVILISGASSGMGMHMAIKLAQEGNIVYAAARRVNIMEHLKQYGIHVLYLDVTDYDSVDKAIECIIDAEKNIDILINNAGYGSFGAMEDVDLEEAHRQFEVNVFGLALLTQKVLPHMRRKHNGTIINIGSIAGRMPILFGTWYNATKYSVRAITETIRMEVKRYGIKTVLIEPGPIATPWGNIAAEHLEQTNNKSVYHEDELKAAVRLRKVYTTQWLTKPEHVAKLVVKITNKRNPRRSYPVGRGSRLLIIAHAVLPASVYEKMVIRFFL